MTFISKEQIQRYAYIIIYIYVYIYIYIYIYINIYIYTYTYIIYKYIYILYNIYYIFRLKSFSLKRSLERSKDLASFKCEIVSLLVSLNSFHLYLFANSVNLSVFEYIYMYIFVLIF